MKNLGTMSRNNHRRLTMKLDALEILGRRADLSRQIRLKKKMMP